MELWLASQEITSSRLRSNKKENTGSLMMGESTADGVPKNIITKENALNGSIYLNNSDSISSSTSQQDYCPNYVEDPLNQVGLHCSAEAEVSSTTSPTSSCQTGKSKDV